MMGIDPNSFLPEPMRARLVTQGRTMLDQSRRIADWQLQQARRMQESMFEAWTSGLDALAPEAKKAAQDETHG